MPNLNRIAEARLLASKSVPVPRIGDDSQKTTSSSRVVVCATHHGASDRIGRVVHVSPVHPDHLRRSIPYADPTGEIASGFDVADDDVDWSAKRGAVSRADIVRLGLTISGSRRSMRHTPDRPGPRPMTPATPVVTKRCTTRSHWTERDGHVVDSTPCDHSLVVSVQVASNGGAGKQKREADHRLRRTIDRLARDLPRWGELTPQSRRRCKESFSALSSVERLAILSMLGIETPWPATVAPAAPTMSEPDRYLAGRERNEL